MEKESQQAREYKGETISNIESAREKLEDRQNGEEGKSHKA